MKQDLTVELDEDTFQLAADMADRQGISVANLLANPIVDMVASGRPSQGPSGR
jgi:hypothetical protein